MEMEALRKLLENVRNGETSVDNALSDLKLLPFEDLGFAKVDHHRNIRNGYPEVIYSQGKTVEQIKAIVARLMEKGNNIMATRAGREVYEGILEITSDAVYYEAARIVVVKKREVTLSDKFIAVVSAGPMC